MPEVRWSRAVERSSFRLPARARSELLSVIGLLRQSPELFAMVDEGRYRGHRRVLIGGYWWLYYRVIDPERTCELVAIRSVRRRPV